MTKERTSQLEWELAEQLNRTGTAEDRIIELTKKLERAKTSLQTVTKVRGGGALDGPRNERMHTPRIAHNGRCG